MDDFFTYLSVGDEDRSWGIFLQVAGKARVDPLQPYPSHSHPSGYFFSWDRGRVLQEFQLNYITEGEGLFEDESGSFPVRAGAIMMVRPGQKHRYKPSEKSGWTENYIGFAGKLSPNFLAVSLFQDSPVIQFGIHEELIDTYHKIFDLARTEEPGFQQIVSGLIVKLLGQLISFDKKRNFSGKHIEKVIQIARFQMRERLDQKVDLHQLALEHHVGYAYLRKMFKKYTGVSPHQYHLEMRIMGAREMILSTDKSIKSICFELGFESLHYFSRLFKKKTGVNPSSLRKPGEHFPKGEQTE